MDGDAETLGCSLSRDELVDRRAAWGDVEPAVVDRQRTEDGFRVRFQAQLRVTADLRALAAAEQSCCGWASWAVTEEDGYAVLEVTGPPGDIGKLAAAFGL